MTNPKNEPSWNRQIALWLRQVISWWNPFHHLWRHSEPTLMNFETWQAWDPKKKKKQRKKWQWSWTQQKSKNICQDTQIKIIGGKEDLPFLLTRFIRKENLDKRGCKITEIVERHKIKADPIFWDQFISYRLELCFVVFWLFQICSIHEHLNLVTISRHDRQWHYIKEKKKLNKWWANEKPMIFKYCHELYVQSVGA